MRNSTLRDHEYTVDGNPASTSGILDCCNFSWLDFSWPALAFCLLIVAFVMVSDGARARVVHIIDRFGDRLVPRAAAASDPDRVLIVTSDPARELTVIATLSPRGLEPLLARDLKGARSQLAAHPAKVRFAVVDAAVPGAASIARALGKTLPPGRIVTLPRGTSREAVGRLLLNRL